MKKDEVGPVHATEIIELGIEGAWLERFPTVSYRYGHLTEVANEAWTGMHQFDPIGHLYFVSGNGTEPRAEWYVHEKTLDRYVLVSGRLRVALFDNREGSLTHGAIEVFEIGGLSSGLPQGMRIPPGVWHSFNSLDGEHMFLNAKHPGYNQADPDKYRIEMPNEKCDFSWD